MSRLPDHLPPPAIVEAIVRYECPKCGNNCTCGVPYVPKTVRAAEAVKANPERSDRAIAKDIGVHHSTVGEARKQLADDPPVARTGLDGKARKVVPRRALKPKSAPPASRRAPPKYVVPRADDPLSYAAGFLNQMMGVVRTMSPVQHKAFLEIALKAMTDKREKDAVYF